MSDLAVTEEGEWDNTQAETEGWSIFSANTGPEFQIQRDDEMAIFAEDKDAWSHVIGQANTGSDYHQRAIHFLHRNAPDELGLMAIAGPLTFQGAPDVALASTSELQPHL